MQRRFPIFLPFTVTLTACNTIMAEAVEKSTKTKAEAASTSAAPSPRATDDDVVSVSQGEDDAIIPKGSIDPVYEKKARVLNHAVRATLPLPPTFSSLTNS